MAISDERPLFKRAKFVGFFITMCIVAIGIIGNVVSTIMAGSPALDAGSMAILMGAVPVGIGMFQHATGKVDEAKASALSSYYLSGAK